MIDIYKYNGERLQEGTFADKDIWISLTDPVRSEIEEVVKQTGVFEDFLTAPLDPEELSRLEIDEDQVLIITNAAIEEERGDNYLHYMTLPVGIIILKNKIITVTLSKIDCIEYFKQAHLKGIDISKKTRFSLQIIYQMTSRYISILRRIDKFSEKIESHIGKEEEINNYLINLLSLEKNLLYFATSVKGNENTVRRIMRTSGISKYEEDEDLLDDTLIELAQAGEMINIDLNILKRIRDTYSSVINTMQNRIMKSLTSLTVVLNVSTIVFSFYGMNTDFGKAVAHIPYMGYIILIITTLVTWVVYYAMKKNKMF